MRHVLVHAHIFKNAGTTFDFSLSRFFGHDFVDHREDREFLSGRNNYLLDYLAANTGVKALSSHSLHFRISGNDDIAVHPVYFLRHPIARVWSVYDFERRQTGVDTEGARRAKELDLNAYVSWYLEEGSPATIRNIHAIFLSGQGPSPDNMEEKVSQAKQYMKSPDVSFAVVERFDDSMVLLEKQLNGMFPGINLAYQKKNVTPSRSHMTLDESVSALMDKLDSDVADRLRIANAGDMALYAMANDRLNAGLGEMVDLESKQAAFAARCQSLQY